MMLNVLRDLPCSGNQPLKSADDYYIILKNKIRTEDVSNEIYKNQEDRTL